MLELLLYNISLCSVCGSMNIIKKRFGKKKERSSVFFFLLLKKKFLYFVLTALCAIVACSWFAHNVIRAFYNPFTPVNTKWAQGILLCTISGAQCPNSVPGGPPKRHILDVFLIWHTHLSSWSTSTSVDELNWVGSIIETLKEVQWWEHLGTGLRNNLELWPKAIIIVKTK